MSDLIASPAVDTPLRYRIRVAEDEWSSLSVRLGTHNRSARGQLLLAICEPGGRTLRSSALELAGVGDNTWVTFSFAPIVGARGRRFRLDFQLVDPTRSSRVSIYERKGQQRAIWARILGRLGIRFGRPWLHWRLNDQALADLNATLGSPEGGSYDQWVRLHAMTPRRISEVLGAVEKLAARPTFSVVVPVYNPPARALERCIESVRDQLYPHWELLLVDDASSAPHVREILHRAGSRDERIRIHFRERNGGISAASNDALRMASGEYVALLDHDDELEPHALFENAAVIAGHPEADFLYSDEDKIDESGRRFDPLFKPDWSPELLHATMYTCHLSVYRLSLVREVGAFRSEFDGTQDFDLALRASERARSIHHIPKVLYHWRTVAASAAASMGAKPHALDRQRRALEAALGRLGIEGAVQPTPFPGNWRVLYSPRGAERVSIVIPTAGRSRSIRGRETNLLLNCVDSIRSKTDYPHYELVVVHNGDLTPRTLKRLEAVPEARLVRYASRAFNLSEKLNLGVDEARGRYVVLLNDDTEVINTDWLRSLVGCAEREGVGAVGAKLSFEDQRYQHVGVVWIDDGPNHAFLGASNGTPGPALVNMLRHDAVAVTGACLLVRRDLYQRVGGFDPAFPLNYNDVDFCMRLRREGYRIVMDPFAQLYHFESASKEGTAFKELEQLLARWGDVRDPYYNVNFRRDRPLYEIKASDEPSVSRDHQTWYLRRVAARRGLHTPKRDDLRLSIITAVFDTPPRVLRELARSIFQQTYGSFEWVIADNGSSDPRTLAVLDEIASRPRVRVLRNAENLGILRGMATALKAAEGEYVLSVDHDDLLAVDALETVAGCLEQHGYPELVYSDEDKCDLDSNQHSPFFKPDWDPVLFLCCCYVAHLWAARRSSLLEAECYTDPGAEGCHDWDAFLRLVRRGVRPIHIPEILYSWRIHPGSTASAETSTKPYTITSQRHVLRRHLELEGRADRFAIEENPLFRRPGMWRVRRARREPARLTLCLVAEHSGEALQQCLEGLARTLDHPVERLVVAGGLSAGSHAAVETFAKRMNGLIERVETPSASARDSPASDVSELARSAGGSFLVVMSDAAVLIDEGWAWEAVGLLQLHGGVVAGGRIVDGSGRLLWAGGFFGFGGFLGSPDAGRSAEDPGYHGGVFCQRSVDGVSPLFFGAEARFVAEVADGPLGTRARRSIADLTSALAVGALETDRRVLYSPFLTARLACEACVRPAEWDVPEGFRDGEPARSARRRYYHRLLSRGRRPPYSPRDDAPGVGAH